MLSFSLVSLMAGCCASAISNGSVITKVEPSFGTLFTVIVPCILSTSVLTIDMPRPVPLYTLRASSRSCENGSKICWRNVSLIPMPVSVIVQRYVTVPFSAPKQVNCVFTLPPTWLNLIALP